MRRCRAAGGRRPDRHRLPDHRRGLAAVARFGLAFIGHTVWQPNDPFDQFGAGAALYGTAVTSVIALAIGTPLGIAMGLFMALMAGPMTRRFVGPLVEMLAAVPSVIVGFWG